MWHNILGERTHAHTPQTVFYNSRVTDYSLDGIFFIVFRKVWKARKLCQGKNPWKKYFLLVCRHKISSGEYTQSKCVERDWATFVAMPNEYNSLTLSRTHTHTFGCVFTFWFVNEHAYLFFRLFARDSFKSNTHSGAGIGTPARVALNLHISHVNNHN